MASSSRKRGRRSFLGGAAALTGAGLLPRPAAGFVPAHNWDRYDWGTAPPVRDRLNQGPFPQYPPEVVLPGSDVVMATTPSDDVVPGIWKGPRDVPDRRLRGRDVRGPRRRAHDRGVRANPARTEALPAPHLARPAEAARPSRPGGVLDGRPRRGAAARQACRLPRDDERPGHRGPGAARLRAGEGPDGPARGRVEARGRHGRALHQAARGAPLRPPVLPGGVPRDGLLSSRRSSTAARSWSTWTPACTASGARGTPGPTAATRSRTTPPPRPPSSTCSRSSSSTGRRPRCVTNTQPDWSRVGNSELVDRTVRSHNWLRTDTIFIENEQIEAISTARPGSRPCSRSACPTARPSRCRSTRA